MLLLISICPTTQATLLAYEAFDYTPETSIAGQSGGSGWAAAWASLAPTWRLATNKAAGLVYADSSGHTLVTSGGSLVVGNPDGPMTSVALPNRALANNLSGGTGTTPGAGGTRWMSFLYQRLNLEAGGAPYWRQANLGLAEGYGERLAVGGPNTSATVSNVFSVWSESAGAVHDEDAPYQSAAHPLLPATTSLILIKVVTDGSSATDTAYVWFNPTNLAVEPSSASADLTDSEADLSSVNTLWFEAQGYNANGTNAACQVDELRVGTTFADVTPNVPYGNAPSILLDPEDLSVIVGQPADFTVTAVGSAPLAYQWYFNTNSALPDATNASYSILSTVLGDAGGYSVVVTNSFGAVTSAVATLTVQALVPPQITVQPQNTTEYYGQVASFSVTADGIPPLHYQWYYNTNTPLADKTNATLNLLVGSPTGAGGYSVVVSNDYGATTSSVAQLTVVYSHPSILPAFPGADGAGKLASGGRGGTVYHVTKLNSALDDPDRNTPGTLLYGLSSGSGPRTIVFDIAGVFHLGLMDTTNWTSGGNAWDSTSRQSISRDNLTIAGQTAPGPVIIMGGTLKPHGQNIVIRNITIAAGYGMRSFWEPGDSTPPPGTLPTSYTMDAMDITGQDIMIDHIDAFYCTDETLSNNEMADRMTIQYCNNALAQNYQGHGYGHIFQGDTDHTMSFIHNLDAHIRSRLPRIGSEVGTGALNDFRNNVFYNWMGTPGYSSSPQPSKNNFVRNFYLAGPGGDSRWDATEGGGTGIFDGAGGDVYAYRSGNLKDINKDGDPNDTSSADADITGVAPQPSAYHIDMGVTLDAKGTLTNVLRYVGSRWWDRDYDIALGNTNAIDTLGERLVHDVIAGTGRIQAWADDHNNPDPNEGAEWRGLWALRMDTNGAAPFNRPAGWDTDQDGMPDDWETEHGLNLNVANNNADFDNDFYTDLEEYLNEVAAWPAPGPIYFTGLASGRYAEIFNWRVTGVNENISGVGNLPTFSLWQPSRYDTAVISNATAVVDAVGQHAGELTLMSSAALNLTNGWLKVAERLENGAGCTTTVSGPGTLTTSNLLNAGTLRLIGAAGLNVSGTFTNTGTLDIMSWSGTLPGGLVNLGTILDSSLVVITEHEVSGTNVTVSIQGYTGHQYQLQYCDDLASGSWQNVGSAVGGVGAPIDFTHSGGGGAQQRLYRVAVD